jgi:TRAP-type C4-dicarboxylate transport system permease small subunit
MKQSTGLSGTSGAVFSIYSRMLCLIVHILVVLAGLGVLTMVAVTCIDVILRLPWINRSLLGAYDIVKITGALTLAATLPYTTAVKGHVAIEYFFHKFNRRGRIVIDTIIRLMGMTLFAFLSWRSVIYGLDLYRIGQVSQTLQLPVFWIPYVIGFCCGIVVLVIGHNLVHPGQEMIKP